MNQYTSMVFKNQTVQNDIEKRKFPLYFTPSPNPGVPSSVVVQSLSHVWLCATPWTAARQAPLSKLSPPVCSNSCPLSRWYHPTNSSSVAPFSSCPQSVPEATPISKFYPFSIQHTHTHTHTHPPFLSTSNKLVLWKWSALCTLPVLLALSCQYV